MIPILYGSNEVNFTSNGLGRLRSCIEAKVVEERNGIYEMDFSYPVDGENYDLIQLGRIVGVTHEDSADIQPFDIVSCSRPIGGVVTFHCTHISYRQSKMVTYGTSVSTLTGAFRIFKQVFYPEKPLGYTSSGNPFVYETDKSGTAYIPAFDGTPRTIRSILGGVEGSILDTFGGEYEWDKWNVILHTARGEAKNFSIRYGVNLIDFQDDTDYGESFNTCIPFWKSTEGEVVIGSEINTEQNTVGVGDKCVPLDLSDKFEEQPTVADLEAMAADIMDANQPYLPKQNIKVDFIRLQDEAGFDQFDSLLQCKLCDSIKVIFPRYDMSAYFKIVKTTWDVLLDRYESMELGNLSTTLAEALGISESAPSSSSTPEGTVPYYTLLWNNSSPSSPMGAQTINAQGLSLYDEVEVLYESAHVYGGRLSQKASYEDGAWITLIGLGGSTGEFTGNAAAYLRTVTMSANSLYIGNAVAGVDNSAYATNNNLCIPLKIYGIKYA